MIQPPKNLAAHQVEMLGRLVQTGIRQLSPGGKARAFVDAVAAELVDIESRGFANLNATQPAYATGASLDMLAQLFGVQRIPAQDARVDTGDENFKFFVKSGTFGDINAGQDIAIPSNVRLTTDARNGPVYLTDPVTLPADASEQYFAARSLNSGTNGNAPAQIFTRHNFTNYADGGSGSLLVSNVYGITGGREAESDENLRYRLYLRLKSRFSANEDSLRYDLLQLPGVQDILFVRRAGISYVYLYGISPVVGPQLIQSAQALLNQSAVFPHTVLAPDLVGISLYTTLRIAAGTSPAEISQVVGAAQQAAENYINNLRIGETLSINEIADRIRNADTRIADVGEPNRQIPEIFVWKSRQDGSRYSRFLINDYEPAVGERIVVESSSPNAVNLEVQ